MGLEVKSQDENCQIKIDGELTIYVANEFKQTLLPALEDFEKMEVDLSRVTEVDSAGVQFLMALKKLSSKSQQKEVRFTHHSQTIIDALELLSLSTRFDDPITLTGEKHP